MANKIPSDLQWADLANRVNAKADTTDIPTTAAEVSALPDTTKYGAGLTVSVNTTNYTITTTLKDQDGNTLGTAQTIDLPLESVVVNGSYDSATKKVILTLQNGNTIEFSVADLVSGLQETLTAGNNIQIAADGKTISATDTTYSAFTGADGTSAGAAGLVPAPAATDNTKFLKGDGTWGDASFTLPVASASTLGGIMVGTNLSISSGVLSADDQVEEFTANEWTALWS